MHCFVLGSEPGMTVSSGQAEAVEFTGGGGGAAPSSSLLPAPGREYNHVSLIHEGPWDSPSLHSPYNSSCSTCQIP